MAEDGLRLLAVGLGSLLALLVLTAWPVPGTTLRMRLRRYRAPIVFVPFGSIVVAAVLQAILGR